MLKIAFIFGTRPETIKMAPLILLAKKDKNITPFIISTGQHQELLDQALSLFEIKPKIDLSVMTKNQTLSSLTSKITKELSSVFEQEKPDITLVQGDTTTAFVGALVSFYHQIPIGHIEAGLRSFDKLQPFPEEINRRLVSTMADFHFAPTQGAKKNLINEGVKTKNIFVAGNTIIDALKYVATKVKSFKDQNLSKLDLKAKNILVTTHRRENLGKPMTEICSAINQLSTEDTQLSFILPMHPNPKVREVLKKNLSKNKQVCLIEPLDYPDFVLMMKKSYLILTDSGGVQEEAPSLGKPVLVMRETTERPEGIKAGTAILIGTNKNKIVKTAKKLLKDRNEYQKIAKKKNPYGDGKSSQRILRIIKDWYKKNHGK